MEQEMNPQSSPQAPVQKYCVQCGTSARLDARFCQNCGLDMVAASPTSTAFSGVDAQSMGEAHELSAVDASTEMSLGTAWMIYLAAMLVLIGTCVLPVGPAFLPVYLVTGFVMTRVVMRRLIEFHPTYYTVGSVFSAKIWMFLLWPLQMGVLLFKLTVNSTL